jgi:predicted nucleic acid-binding Zn ribbon protein
VPDQVPAGDSERGRGRRPASEQQISKAREALAAARAAAGTRPGQLARRPKPDPAAGEVPGDSPAGAEAGRTPAEPPRAFRRFRRDDPQALGAAIGGLLDDEGWNLAAATGSVFGRWAQIVGSDLAGHTWPESLRDGELTVQADSTAWATQLRLLAAQLVHRLNAELGTGTVLRVKVRGPVTADRKPGEWRVRGGRGPRDTYG